MTAVEQFEKEIAAFFGAPFCVAVDSCTHGIELCLRLSKVKKITCPTHTYLSVPMLAKKLDIELEWVDVDWDEYYELAPLIYDAAVLWRKDGYIPGTYMNVSCQYQKHLSVGRLGFILCSNSLLAQVLRAMAHDGRTPGIPWREQPDIEFMGYHYYAQPELAQAALNKLSWAIETPPRKWDSQTDWPDISNYTVFK